ncbi:MAG: YybS family protein [Acetobacteraceae bacterium]|nr:YybS family protein [Acetobacteraceae bacterium]
MARPMGTRPLVEGALLAAIAVVIILAGTYIPLVGPVMVFLWPVPIVVIQLRRGLRVSLLVLAVTCLALSAFLGPVSAVTLVISLGAAGIVLGEGVRRNWPASWVLASGTAAVAAALLVTLGVSLWVLHINPIELQFEALQRSLEITAGLYERLGAGQAFAPARQAMEEAIAASRYLLPALLVMGAAFNAFLNYVVGSAVLARLGHRPQPLPPFARWKLPLGVVFVYAAALGMLVGGQRLKVGFLEVAGSNVITALNLAFLIEGIAVAYFYLSRLSVPKWFRILILVYLPFGPLVGQLLLWAGMLDVAIDLRRFARQGQAT